jgi:hypothetical protein
LPRLQWPDFEPALLEGLVPGALAIVMVGYAEALGAAKAAAMQSGGAIDPNQELIAHGPANILSGLFGGFLVVIGSLSKTSVAMGAGAHTQIANLIAASFCFLTLVLLTPLFRDMPHPALSLYADCQSDAPGVTEMRVARPVLSQYLGTELIARRPASDGRRRYPQLVDWVAMASRLAFGLSPNCRATLAGPQRSYMSSRP